MHVLMVYIFIGKLKVDLTVFHGNGRFLLKFMLVVFTSKCGHLNFYSYYCSKGILYGKFYNFLLIFLVVLLDHLPLDILATLTIYLGNIGYN